MDLQPIPEEINVIDLEFMRYVFNFVYLYNFTGTDEIVRLTTS